MANCHGLKMSTCQQIEISLNLIPVLIEFAGGSCSLCMFNKTSYLMPLIWAERDEGRKEEVTAHHKYNGTDESNSQKPEKGFKSVDILLTQKRLTQDQIAKRYLRARKE